MFSIFCCLFLFHYFSLIRIARVHNYVGILKNQVMILSSSPFRLFFFFSPHPPFRLFASLFSAFNLKFFAIQIGFILLFFFQLIALFMQIIIAGIAYWLPIPILLIPCLLLRIKAEIARYPFSQIFLELSMAISRCKRQSSRGILGNIYIF